ncbi:MAG: hypothetical protein QXI01_02230 [Nitrososphaerota archaeon]
MERTRKKAQSNLLTITIITAMVIGVGLALFSLISSYSEVSRLKSSEEVTNEILVLRSAISADYVFGGNAYIRNTGKEPVVIFRLIVLNNGTLVWDSGIKKIIELGVGEVDKVTYECPSCRDSDPIVLQVHYIPSKLYDPSNPELINPTSNVVLFRVESFPVERVSLGSEGICPVSSNWIWSDFVDPIEEGIGGELSNLLKIRLSKASVSKDVELQITIKDEYGNLAEGSKTLPSMSNVDETVELQSSNVLKYPVEITLSIKDQGWNIMPEKWYFGREETSYVDLVKILWDSLSYRVIGVFVKAYHDDSGTYKVTVNMYDCYGDLIAYGSSEKEVEAYIWEEYNIALSSNPIITDVYFIEINIVDVSPLVTVTKTITETVTITTTRTFTSTVTVPLTTQTITSTTTSTSTRWTTIATRTLTTTVTRTTTVYSPTTTRTRTVTVTLPTTTRTTTATITSTIGTTVATKTVTSTVTSSSTVATTTQTTTITLGSTTTKTEIVTVTTTTTRGSSTVSSSEHNAFNAITLALVVPVIFSSVLRVFRNGGRKV